MFSNENPSDKFIKKLKKKLCNENEPDEFPEEKLIQFINEMCNLKRDALQTQIKTMSIYNREEMYEHVQTILLESLPVNGDKQYLPDILMFGDNIYYFKRIYKSKLERQ